MTLNQKIKMVQKALDDNSPVLLTAVGVAGTITTGVLAARGGYKAAQELSVGDPGETTQEKAKRTWKYYMPAVGTGAATIGCIVMANRIGTKRAAALAAAYSISEKAFGDYREKVTEKLGEKKEQAVRDEVVQAKVDATTAPPILVGDGEVLCFDAYSGRYFRNSFEGVKKAQNDLNYRVLSDGYASLGDFYSLVGLERTAFSDEFGWNSDKQMDLEFSSVLSPDGKPCLAIDFRVAPIRDYYGFR